MSNLGLLLGTAYGLGGSKYPFDTTGLLIAAEADATTKDGSDNISAVGDSDFTRLVNTDATSTKPLFVASVDGKNAWRHDGVDSYLVTESPITIVSTFALFVGFRTYDPDTARVVVELSVDFNVNNALFLLSRGAANTPTIAARQQTGDVISMKEADDTSWAVGAFVRSRFDYGGTHTLTKLFVGGVEEATTTRNPGVSDEDPDPSTTADLYVGGRAGTSLFSESDLRYLFLFSPEPSAQIKADAEGFFAGKW